MFISNSNKQLRDSLVQLNLCTDYDFRRCRRRVRRLARGIPAFDFVWIDALVQSGSLTPFQAKVLESNPPENLCVGPCILLERLGHGEISETFLARPQSGTERVVLKRLRPSQERFRPALERLQRDVESLRGLTSAFIAGPQSVAEHNGSIVVISRYVAGPACRDLLVRRGRFPIEIVAEIARQLAEGLAVLEARGCLHGAINLGNVRLTSNGQAVLVDAGIGQAFECGLSIRDDVAPDIYDGTAPELIGTGNLPTTATAVYSFGCLLWQLLAGRAPFPTGDPLGKLAAHRSKAVPDVRDLAPDTPAPLAEAIRTFTRRDPCQRPATFAEVSANLGSANKIGQRRLERFRRLFDTAAPREMAPLSTGSRFPAAIVLALLFIVSGVAVTLLDAGAKARLLQLRSGVSSWLSKVPEQSVETCSTTEDNSEKTEDLQAQRLQPLPAPSADGIILLDAGPYEGEAIAVVGDLTIRGSAKAPAVIVVRDRPFEVVCRKFALEHVIVRIAKPAQLSLHASAVAVRSQELSVEHCAFVEDSSTAANSADAPAFRRDVEAALPVAIIWTKAAARDPDAGHIRLSNTVFLNVGPAVVCVSAPGRLEADNCLKIGGVLFDLREHPTTQELSVQARHVTLRQAESLCMMSVADVAGRRTQLRAALFECAFDLAGAASGLIRLQSEKAPNSTNTGIVVTGNESVVRPGVQIVYWQKPSGAGEIPVDLRSIVVEGLSVGEFQFVGSAGPLPGNSLIKRASLQIPRRSEELPGIAAGGLIAVSQPVAVSARIDKSRDPERR